jgi:drug/metabolite transporter (DMT)-like permease
MSTRIPPQLFAYLSLGTGVVIIGCSAIFIRLADAPGTISAFYRMAIASLLVVLPLGLQVRKKKNLQPRRGIRLAILGGIFFGLDLTFWSTGIMLSGATNPTLMANTAPLWVGLGALFIFKEDQNARFWAGLLVAMAGAAVVLGADISRAIEIGLGTFLSLMAAVFYAGYLLVSQRGRADLNTLAYFWITTLVSAILLLVVNILFNQSLTAYPVRTYLIFLAQGILVQVVGWLAINYGQGYLPASIVAPTLLGQPVVTAIIAWLLLGESLTNWQVLGGGMVLLGVFIVHRSRRGGNKLSKEKSGPILEVKT